VPISALTGDGIDQLLAAIDEALPLDPIVRATFRLSAGDGASMALLHEFGQVIETRYDGEFCELEAEIPESLQRRLDGRKRESTDAVEKIVGKGAPGFIKVS
jgi:GTP-binding protein HflX